ncbi:hypothetical protein SAMN06264364_111113 [Quadrisphaera granulorum]|uniref:ABC-2 family transporter n=1 Tax=Quadrisphaera granulorum TaxID=317664 RepID=A0A316A9N7_9ACTN|nr:hypothetical protein [Quadrisphaera granulorum]PWJ53710.1 hypothetical protein BXY45_111113 [Quadrisphaera granulorum]SZE96754.1 hypothetical protein SAMN06264364_111113 [Quadrisphaera granulorum]
MFWRTLHSEALKAATQPAVARIVVAPLIVCAALTPIAASQVNASLHGAPGAGQLIPGTNATNVGPEIMGLWGFVPVVVGVLLASSEHHGGQWTTTVLTTPRRGQVVAAKAVLCAALNLTLATIYAALVVIDYQTDLGPGDGLGELSVFATGRAPAYLGVLAMAVLYWVLIGLVSLALAIALPSPVAPMVLMVLLAVTADALMLINPVFRFVPTIAGMQMFAPDQGIVLPEHPAFAPLTATLVVAGWALGMTVLAWALLTRRDIGGRRAPTG